MKAPAATLFCAMVLIIVGLIGALIDYPDLHPTAFIPVGFGVVLLALLPGVRKENKIIAHIAVVLVLLILIALIMPLKGQIASGDPLGIARVAVMMLACVIAMVSYINSFRAARRAS